MQEMELFDADGDGVVTEQEAHAVLEQVLGYSLQQTQHLFRAADKNKDGKLSKDEFVDFFFKMREKIRELKSIFQEFDTDGNGYITLDEARQAMKNLSLSEFEIETLVRAYDTTEDGCLQYEEFVKMWNSV